VPFCIFKILETFTFAKIWTLDGQLALLCQILLKCQMAEIMYFSIFSKNSHCPPLLVIFLNF